MRESSGRSSPREKGIEKSRSGQELIPRPSPDGLAVLAGSSTVGGVPISFEQNKALQKLCSSTFDGKAVFLEDLFECDHGESGFCLVSAQLQPLKLLAFAVTYCLQKI
jgi:hypothetical protein